MIYDRHTPTDPPAYVSSITQPTQPGRTVAAPHDTGTQAVSVNTSAAAMAAIGYWPRADRPAAPSAAHTWVPADPAYALVDGKSVPQGQWVAPDMAALRETALVRVRAEADALLNGLIPSPWDRLQRSSEYEVWIEETAKPAVSELLAAAEAAIAAATTAEVLAAITVAWEDEP